MRTLSAPSGNHSRQSKRQLFKNQKPKGHKHGNVIGRYVQSEDMLKRLLSVYSKADSASIWSKVLYKIGN